MNDSDFQALSTVQSGLQPKPVTIASTTVIAPTTFITFVSGTINVSTITPPVEGSHMLCIIPTDAAGFVIDTGGNVLVGSTTLADNTPVLLVYDPIQAKYLGVSGYS